MFAPRKILIATAIVWSAAACLFLTLRPAAIAAEAGVGEEFFRYCFKCHGSVPEYPLLGARAGYDRSGHWNFGNAYYANGAGCQQCHTNEGFIEYVLKGTVDPKSYVAYPSQPGCFTCHDPHGKGDFSLRLTAAVKLANGKTYNQGNGNLCAACHQARQDAAKEVREMPSQEVAGHWGAHHGPQADMVSGTNAYEFKDRAYSSSDHSKALENGCVDCHMALPEGRYSLSPMVGGHSFNIVGDVHQEERLNTAGCVSCHENIKQVPGESVYDIRAEADYDGDGAVEPLQAEVQGLLDRFVNDQGNGYLQKTDPPMYNVGGLWMGSGEGAWTTVQMAALYNYKFVLEDGSRGVHNAGYALQVLFDSLKALDPDFDNSRRPE